MFRRREDLAARDAWRGADGMNLQIREADRS